MISDSGSVVAGRDEDARRGRLENAAAHAEREATANALRVREGKSIDSGSRCSDGGWKFDGTTLRFSGEIATSC